MGFHVRQGGPHLGVKPEAGEHRGGAYGAVASVGCLTEEAQLHRTWMASRPGAAHEPASTVTAA
jgi:hypothetical protein